MYRTPNLHLTADSRAGFGHIRHLQIGINIVIRNSSTIRLVTMDAFEHLERMIHHSPVLKSIVLSFGPRWPHQDSKIVRFLYKFIDALYEAGKKGGYLAHLQRRIEFIWGANFDPVAFEGCLGELWDGWGGEV